MPAKKDEVYIALDSASADLKGVTYNIIKGKRYPGSHPVVKHAPELFEKGSVFDEDVEAASAAPGEKRP